MLERLKTNLIDFTLMVGVVTAVYSGLKYIYTRGYEDCQKDCIEIIEHLQDDKEEDRIY